jgi:hypothetical protein
MIATKNTGTRFARWLKSFKQKNRAARRWYEHSMYNA